MKFEVFSSKTFAATSNQPYLSQAALTAYQAV